MALPSGNKNARGANSNRAADNTLAIDIQPGATVANVEGAR